ncbi:MAG: hypothetical protein IKT00_02735 [Prevotella sp.]|nr:hypothetical protein [Prevotella sp.]
MGEAEHGGKTPLSNIFLRKFSIVFHEKRYKLIIFAPKCEIVDKLYE